MSIVHRTLCCETIRSNSVLVLTGLFAFLVADLGATADSSQELVRHQISRRYQMRTSRLSTRWVFQQAVKRLGGGKKIRLNGDSMCGFRSQEKGEFSRTRNAWKRFFNRICLLFCIIRLSSASLAESVWFGELIVILSLTSNLEPLT